MKRMGYLLIPVLVLIIICIGFKYSKFYAMKNGQNKKLFNIVLVGAAGSGKGTQGDILKKKMNLLQVSAGELLRKHREANGKYAATINEYIDKGQLVPTEITHELIREHITNNALCKDCKYKGVIFDGFPRAMEQLYFLDSFLMESGNKINAVVYIDVPEAVLLERLMGRFACKKCGENYHKITKPRKVEGVCDVCGSHEFTSRSDDKSVDAIHSRFKIFEESTKPVLDTYEERGIVVRVNGNNKPEVIAEEIMKRLKTLKKRKI